MSDPLARDVEAPYYLVAPHKLIVMSVTTLSTYQIYWFYQNYLRLRARTGGGGSPFWRAVAAPLTAHGFFAHVRADAQSRLVPVRWTAGGLAIIYLGLTLVCFFEYPWWTLALGSVFALLPAHATMEAVNRKVSPSEERNGRYSVLDIVCIAIGIALTIVALHVTRMESQFVQRLLDEL